MFDFEQLNTLREIETPFYYYDLELLEQNLQKLQSSSIKNNVHIHYALKANTNGPILNLVRKYGFGADCVSGNEIKCAIENGFPPSRIVFAGVGKTDREIHFALDNHIGCLNVESIQELEVINEISQSRGQVAPIAMRINPDFNGNTHHKITTGTRLDKFGIQLEELDEVIFLLPQLKNIRFEGLHFHIGSQITDLNVFEGLAQKINEIQLKFNQAGFQIKTLNLGGGLGVNYENPDEQPLPDYEGYFDAYLNILNILPGQQIHFELGRSIVAACGNLISRVLYIKKSGEESFAILDAGMNNLMRPALYDAYHKIQNLSKIGKEVSYHIVGPICESSDVFGRNVLLPELKRGDLIAIRTAGAYGEVMASSYNLRSPAKAIYSNELNTSKNKLTQPLPLASGGY